MQSRQSHFSAPRPVVAWLLSGLIHVAVAAGLLVLLRGMERQIVLDHDPLVLPSSVMPIAALRPLPPPPLAVEVVIAQASSAEPLSPPAQPPLRPEVPAEEEAAVVATLPLSSAADQELSLVPMPHPRRPVAQPTPAVSAQPAVPAPAAAPALAPTATLKVSPDYPASARRQGLEGDVTLLIDIAADGTPTEVVVDRSSGHQVLDACALAAVRRWRFAVQAGAAARTRITIIFRLT